jgi:hypothetical protein
VPTNADASAESLGRSPGPAVGANVGPIVDSARIYAPLLRVILSSIRAFVVDLVKLLVKSAGRFRGKDQETELCFEREPV